MSDEPFPLTVTELGQYIRYNCERRFKLGFKNMEKAEEIPFAPRLFNTIDPVLSSVGKEKENELAQELQHANFSHITYQNYDPRNTNAQSRYPLWANFVNQLENLELDQNAFAREVRIEGIVDNFRVRGRIDFILIFWRNGRPILRITEVKASRRDRTCDRIQLALYYMIIKQLIEATPLYIQEIQIMPNEIECSIIRIDQEQNRIQSILNTLPLDDLSQEEADIKRLLSPDGKISHIITSQLDQLPYKLEVKCDDCIFSVNCLPESSLKRRLELLSLTPCDIRILMANGVQTIDNLATLDLNSQAAGRIESDPAFSSNLQIIQKKARARRSTLPGGRAHPNEYQVEQLPFHGYGTLPEHIINNESLIRIFLTVDHDYVEDRIVALSAHVTSSLDEIATRIVHNQNGERHFDPTVYEIDHDGQFIPLNNRPIVKFRHAEWRGNYNFDSGMEAELIQSFFIALVERIAEVANGRIAVPIHIYVWSREELTHLIEACSRVDTRLLSHLRELFGCREPLDQLIFSCLRNEINQRYALGWTGRGLSVLTSLSWFGKWYHWTRRVNNNDVWLRRIFNQDIFDFKTPLKYHDDQTWADRNSTGPDVRSHTFELRSRFNDSLPVPYWHAIWGSLPDSNDPNLSPRERGSIKRYNLARIPGYMKAFQGARVHALRWLEERVRPKNRDITKLPITIADLPTFDLNVDNPARAAIDFLRLDYYVKRTDWITQNLIPPTSRIRLGETIPVRNVHRIDNGNLIAEIHSTGYEVDLNL